VNYFTQFPDHSDLVSAREEQFYTHELFIMYVMFSDRQHVEAAQANIFSFFFESDNVVETSGNVCFQPA